MRRLLPVLFLLGCSDPVTYGDLVEAAAKSGQCVVLSDELVFTENLSIDTIVSRETAWIAPCYVDQFDV